MATYTPAFTVDYAKCGNPPSVNGNSVSFGESFRQTRAGRVVSQNGYTNITEITAKIDLSGLAEQQGWAGNFVNAAFYIFIWCAIQTSLKNSREETTIAMPEDNITRAIVGRLIFWKPTETKFFR